jgi:flagellin-like hook-associated protein FlgL
MDLRITPQVVIDLALSSIRDHSDRLGQLQEEAATGNRINAPSDDPLATVQVMNLNSQNVRLDAYTANAQTATADLNQSVSVLQEAGTVLSSASQIASEASNSTNLPADFSALATEVDGLIGRMLQLANTNNSGRYLFSGTTPTQTPFAIAATNSAGLPTSIVYQGGSDATQIPIGQRQNVATLYAGSQVFQQRQRSVPVYTGTTGATPGTGTDSATGQGTLVVTHTSTVYAAGSGIQAGTNSVAGDNILGPAGSHTLTVVDTSGTGASGTVSLDGGPAIAFTNSDTNLAVSGPGGEKVYVNTTAITPSFNGTVAITSNGTLSTDGGASTVAINFSSNQVVTNSSTGAVTNVNSANIRSTGTEDISYTGTYDVFQALISLRDDLRNTRGLSQTDQIQSLSQRIGELDQVRGGISQALGEQSASLQNLSALTNRIKQVQLDLTSRSTDLQGADLSQVVVGLQTQQNFLTLALGAFSRIMNQSLLNFLQ